MSNFTVCLLKQPACVASAGGLSDGARSLSRLPQLLPRPGGVPGFAALVPQAGQQGGCLLRPQAAQGVLGQDLLYVQTAQPEGGLPKLLLQPGPAGR